MKYYIQLEFGEGTLFFGDILSFDNRYIPRRILCVPPSDNQCHGLAKMRAFIKVDFPLFKKFNKSIISYTIRSL